MPDRAARDSATPERRAPAIDHFELEDRYQIRSYAKWPFTLVRGAACRVWDDQGREYLDLYGGHCVALIGHCHPHWVSAVSSQAARLGFYSNVAANDVRARYQEKLVGFLDNHLTRVFLCNSGAEANETAIKMAVKATGRSRVLCLEGGFHGRTAGALAVTSLGPYRSQFPSLVQVAETVAFGDLEALRSALTSEVAAVILEPVQSMQGVRMAPPDYYPALIEICHGNGTLVIFDEVQTALGRLGAPLAVHALEAAADLVTTAKGIGNGFPMAAVLAGETVSSNLRVGELGTTFGGGPLACAAGLAVLEVVEEEGLLAHALQMEQVARELLVSGPIRAVRGKGLLLGLETRAPAREVCQFLQQQGILTGTSADPRVLRLMPPLIVQEQDLEMLAQTLAEFPES